MKTRTLAVVAIAAAGALALHGCAGRPTDRVTGVVAPSTGLARPGTRAPEITFTDRGGKLRRLSSLYDDATIVAFVKAACSESNAELLAAGGKLGGRVSVVEICTCDDGCEAHEQCMRTRGDKSRRLISICDARGLAKRWYGIATDTAAFVLDREGTIVAYGTLADLGTLRQQAQTLADQAQEWRESVYGSG